MHLISKMRSKSNNNETGSRIGIILNGSPLFTGGAGSGESEIRRYILENDLLEAIIALPTDMFYNTGIATYVWVISNGWKKMCDSFSKDQCLACMSGTKEFENPCSLERATLNASSALTADVSSFAIFSQPNKTLLACDCF
jgi:hypothetical protein